MSSFNRGEWSEVYVVLFLLVKPKLNIVDEHFNTIDDALYIVKDVCVGTDFKLDYKIINEYICLYINNNCLKKFSSQEIETKRQVLLKEILKARKSDGAFEIPSFSDFLDEFSNNNVIKAKSKADTLLIVGDNRINKSKNLYYSVKSCLGSPATILNSSQNTNFKYKIIGLNPSYIFLINSIDSRTKIKDRIAKIIELGGTISFDKVVTDTMEYNLKMVDSNMPTYLGNALLESYISENKYLKEVFLKANTFEDENIGIKKLGDFLSAISFGFIPGKKWDGTKSVNGGLIIVEEDGDIVVLDLVYYSDSINKYIVNESKFDTPSATRYHMAELKNEGSFISFTLNLQIRYK